MMFNLPGGGKSRPGLSVRGTLLAALLVLTGCGGADRVAGSATTGAGQAAAPQDPMGRFLAGAAPGQEGTVAQPDGRVVRVRVVRAYAAASGRECREVLLGEGIGGRASVLCDAGGQWVAARPLLLGSGSPRP